VNVPELERQVEYKCAPAPLLAVQALANTFAFEPEEERLLDPESARGWLLGSELATADLRVDEADWRRLRDLRAAIRDLIEANLDGDPGPAAVRLRSLAADHPVPVAVSGRGELSLDLAPADSVDGVIAQLIGIVLQAQSEGRWERLKICASDECRWSFFDNSRNRGGTWCSMQTCGNVVKNRAYRRRRSEARA